MRPEIGAVTRVKSRLSAATSSAACAASTFACPCSRPDVRVSNSSCEIACCARSFVARSRSERASISCERACASCARALSRSATYGLGSMTNSTSPLRTSLPSLKLTDEIYPDTRGRISTRSTASKRPVNSPESVTLREIVVATVTCGTGGAAWDCAASLREQALSSRAIADAASNGKEWRTRLSQNGGCRFRCSDWPPTGHRRVAILPVCATLRYSSAGEHARCPPTGARLSLTSECGLATEAPGGGCRLPRCSLPQHRATDDPPLLPDSCALPARRGVDAAECEYRC